MLDPEKFLDFLRENGIEFFTGVPDSLLKHACACLTTRLPAGNHVLAANEGGAIGLAIGHHLATGKVPFVYMQNSGLGNTVNPLLSLASREVYAVPMLLMIGWRGRPGVKDEPQHVHQGRVTRELLEVMDIPTIVLSDEMAQAAEQVRQAVAKARSESAPVALLVNKGTFADYQLDASFPDLPMTREEAIIKALSLAEDDAAIVSTTGMPSREVFEYRARAGGSHEKDFLTVGGMGHANQIALGIALSQPDRPVYCLDGDGAAIMHMGSMGIVAQSNAGNYIHLLLNNGCHESVGGQPTVGFDLDFPSIAAACGYRHVGHARTPDELEREIAAAQRSEGAAFIEVQVRAGHRSDIGRPTVAPVKNKEAMMDFLNGNGG